MPKKKVSAEYDSEFIDALIEAAVAWRDEHTRVYEPTEQALLDVLNEYMPVAEDEYEEDEDPEELSFD